MTNKLRNSYVYLNEHKKFFSYIKSILSLFDKHKEYGFVKGEFEKFASLGYAYKDNNPLLLPNGNNKISNNKYSITKTILSQFLIMRLSNSIQHENGITTIKGLWAAYAYEKLTNNNDYIFDLETLHTIFQESEGDNKQVASDFLGYYDDTIGQDIRTYINQAVLYIEEQ